MDNFYKSGIHVRLELLINFPGTEIKDVRDTYYYLIKNRNKIDSVNISFFELTPGCEVYLHPDKFGVEVLDQKDDGMHGFQCPKYQNTKGMPYDLGRKVPKEFIENWSALDGKS